MSRFLVTVTATQYEINAIEDIIYIHECGTIVGMIRTKEYINIVRNK